MINLSNILTTIYNDAAQPWQFGFQDSAAPGLTGLDRKSTRLNSSHDQISYAVFCLKKKTDNDNKDDQDQPHHETERLDQQHRAPHQPTHRLRHGVTRLIHPAFLSFATIPVTSRLSL